MNADTLRNKFLSFFKAKKHKVVDSDSLVPKNDPTVLFTPAGMNQFKKQFLGSLSGFSRAATSQRCLRTADLEKVGKTSGHHTFFEMLGNFSFGDYFKQEAISWAWEFLTKELKIPAQKLWVSVYHQDEEAYAIWKDKIKIPVERIVKLGDKENFWPAEAKLKGPNGPCGPCSEIFYDYGEQAGCGRPDCTPACDCKRFIEIWNLVFTQYNRKDKGVLEPLPNKNIDTGMGLERLTAVIQGAKNNFETDLFKPLIDEIGTRCKGQVTSEEKKLIYAVADHTRAIVFSIYDGVMPSNEGRGYVIRKIIRRSILHLRSLGITKPFLNRLVPVLAETMSQPYPELAKRREDIAQVILAEENNFISMLDSSAAILKDKFAEFTKKPDPQKAGSIAFQLYDTYGLPFEITRDWADKHNIKISEDAFEKKMFEQKERSKNKSAMKGDVFNVKGLHLGIKATKFLGYEKSESPAKILAIFKDGKELKKAARNEVVNIILDKTTLYGESGGQIGDKGIILKGKNQAEVTDSKKSDKNIVHTAIVKKGAFKKGDLIKVVTDRISRLAIERNHTATHLLQSALRSILGAHVKQQGSFVGIDRLRFDFTHFKALTAGELERVEELVNTRVLADTRLCVKQSKLKAAKKQGALAFFAEKYEDNVRIVDIPDISKELCAGTHLKSTGQIGLFKIVQESAIASGIRRIEAVTGEYALALAAKQNKILNEASRLLGIPAERLSQEIEKRLEKIRSLEKKLDEQKTSIVKESIDSLIDEPLIVNGIKLITKSIDNADMGFLRNAVDAIKKNNTGSIIALAGKTPGKVILVIGVTDDLAVSGKDASGLIKQIGPIIGGSGGGRANFAQAGGSNPEKIDEAFKKLKEILGA